LAIVVDVELASRKRKAHATRELRRAKNFTEESTACVFYEIFMPPSGEIKCPSFERALNSYAKTHRL
jgi:hypothetical protein